MEKEIIAAIMASTSDVDMMTNDRIEALTKGHGMLNIAAICAANSIAEDVQRGTEIKLTDHNVQQLPIDDVLKKAIDSAALAGADPANAALISATLCYFAGTNAQAGVPAGNRKLGAMARIIAGVDRCGVIAIPTAKVNNRISGYAAVRAVYDDIFDNKITKIDGSIIPMGVGGGPLYGHGALGEDIAFPELARNGAAAGTKGMLKAYANVGMPPSPITAAIFGAAAILEIVHPDSEIGEKYGELFKDNSAYVAGLGAVEAAGLPEKLHIRGTGEEYDTAHLVGDLGVILKDIGGPSVIGMMAFEEMLSAFEESLAIGAGFSGGPLQPPLGHMTADAVLAMKVLISSGGDLEVAADKIKEIKENFWLEPELAKVATNTISRKAEQVKRGPVTKAMILATDGGLTKAVSERAKFTYDKLKEGKKLDEIVRMLDDEKLNDVETACSALFSGMMGKDIKINITRYQGCGRRTPNAFLKRYCGFDTDTTVEVTVDGEKIVFDGLSQKVIPDAVVNKKMDILEAIPLAAVPVVELQLCGHTIINIIVPAAVAATMNSELTPREIARKAVEGAYISSAIPGGVPRAEEVSKRAIKIMSEL
ncbi:MAG: hypothetical protein KO318_06845 [Methanobacterium sp.]|uniref:hypothetical protein n=1 Tax=unclassified Methanobacterium TaxID=2627676 RepID=UPI000C2CF712|nr:MULTISPECIES: hypothetical protein [unclassified Methanobacterium]AUB57771.1 hypothetical protein BK008_05230 [Methanobacterium sp. MZ-A1]MCC7560129.1 hypothetical protein [Methanobacterium sp.]